MEKSIVKSVAEDHKKDKVNEYVKALGELDEDDDLLRELAAIHTLVK